MALRAVAGIEPREDFPALPRFEELLAGQHLLISKHTRRHLKTEHFMPGRVVDRANRSRWQAEGALSLHARARAEVERLVESYELPGLPDDVSRELTNLMQREARRYGMDHLPP